MRLSQRAPAAPAAVAVAVLLLLVCDGFAGAAELQVLLPQGRTAYQTNETIDLAVVRSDAMELKAGELKLMLTGDAGSTLSFTFTVQATQAVQGQGAKRTEHLHLSGWLLRPGTYAVEVSCDGATGKGGFELYSHVRRSSFRLVNWGRADKKELQLPQGEDSLGFNLYYGGYANDDEANFIRAGVDFMGCCVMSGGHQMDLRMECDWSDPYVTRGGTARVVRRAFIDRTRGNVPGVHFYDEPGLTWMKDPAAPDKLTPHGIPSQRRAYQAAFGRDMPDPRKVDPANPAAVAEWKHWANWKLGFMDSAWKEAQFGVSYVRPDYLSLTQSQYGATAFTDGYYFNVVRSLPITSGHGGYDDFGLAYYNPSFTLELARARDHTKPCWYLPTWYGNTPPDRFRMEQYLSFMTNIQGMISPPDLEPAINKDGRQGIVESNQLMGRLGTIFTTMPVTRPPVAMLYSLSDAVEHQVRTKGEISYTHATPQGEKIGYTYLAGKLLQQQFLFVVEEDVLDGTLAANHKAVILTAVHYLDPKVVKALERFAANGGLVILTGDCKVKINGATNLGASARHPDEAKIKELVAQQKYQEANVFNTAGKQFQGAQPLVAALKPVLEKAGIEPVFTSDNPQIAASRQAEGDVEYLFAVNATYDEEGANNPARDEKESKMNLIKAATATIGLEPDGRPVYDAISGGEAREFKQAGNQLAAPIRFGPGQMRVFARTARPIGKVVALPAVVARDFTRAEQPISLTVGGTLLDNAGRVLAGSVPLQLRVIDPLGVVRHEIYRATKSGTFTGELPLAANDPAGRWKVVVKELLNNTEDAVGFTYNPARECGAVAGGHYRAAFFVNDDDNIFRFARLHRQVTIVKGAGDFNAAAAERLTKILAPWDVRATTINAADVKVRQVSEEAVATWVGLDFGKIDPATPRPGWTGYDLTGASAVILLGNVEDNALIKYLQDNRFLPIVPKRDELPGRGRGLYAWQRDGVGHGVESVALIAYDAEGMGEAVGSFYEAVQGMDPLTRWSLPAENSVEPAKEPTTIREASRLWEASLPDRVIGLKAEAGKLTALTADGSMTTLGADGKVIEQKALTPAELQQAAAGFPAPADRAGRAAPGRVIKFVRDLPGDRTAIVYWGGGLEVINTAADTTIVFQQMRQDVTALAALEGKLVVGLATGQVMALDVK